MAKHYHPMPRYLHTSAKVANKVVVYSGDTEDRLEQTKKSLASIVEVFSPYSERWEATQSTGQIPAPGLCGAASAVVNGHLYFYGGWDRDGELVNSLHQLDATTYEWRELNAKGAASPMPKWGAAMVPCEDGLTLFGGSGLPHSLTRRGSSFMRDTFIYGDGRGWTNEFHIYHLSEGVWSSPATTGKKPPPCAWFSLTSIDQRRTVLFGGYNGEESVMNDVYILDRQSLHWTKLKRSGEPWPDKRSRHAASCLNYGQQHPQLLVTGGVTGQRGTIKVLGDAWILDVNSGRWRKVMHTLQPRYGHSSTAIRISSTLTEIILFGGEDGYFRKLAGTTVLQFRDSWELPGVVEPKELGQSEERLREKIECASLFSFCVGHIVNNYEFYQPLLPQLLPHHIHTHITSLPAWQRQKRRKE